MASIRDAAEQFFNACETGKGWEVCKQYCQPGATFSAQADALAGVDTLQAYTEWMKGLLTPVPDGRYEIRSFAVDQGRNNVAAYGVFRGTHTGQGGPVPPTGKRVEADYGVRWQPDSAYDEDLERCDQPEAAGMDVGQASDSPREHDER